MRQTRGLDTVFVLLMGLGRGGRQEILAATLRDESASVVAAASLRWNAGSSTPRETPEGCFLRGRELHRRGIMLLCIMETDLALFLACMPTVEERSGERGSAGTSTCTEHFKHA